MSETRGYVAIWFFIGALLFVYGLLILGTGIYHLFVPPKHPLALAHLHADLWWGILLVALGAFYSVRFFPGRAEGQAEHHTGS